MKTVDLKTIERKYAADGTYRLVVDGHFIGFVRIENGKVEHVRD
jgi:hypothetical protein